MSDPSGHHVGQDGWKQDTTSIILHARRMQFVTLLVCLLVVLSIFFDDTYGLSNALEEMKLANGLMAVWHQETSLASNKPLTEIVSRKPPPRKTTPTAFELTIAPLNHTQSAAQTRCTAHLHLNQRFFVNKDQEVNNIRIGPDRSIRVVRLIDVNRYSIEPWLVESYPTTLRDFSLLWNTLQSSNQIAYISQDNIREAIDIGLLRRDTEIYKVLDSKLTKLPPRLALETTIEKMDFYLTGIESSPELKQFASTEEFISTVALWRSLNFDTVAATNCVIARSARNERRYVLFTPVSIWQASGFSWTEEWLRKAMESKFVSKDNFIRIASLAERDFANVFPNLSREAAGLESLDLLALQGWLEQGLRETSQSIELGGVRVSMDPLRYFGMLVILVVQGYAVLHLAEARRRMQGEKAIDPGAFQPWLVLYGQALCVAASIVILVAPAVATFAAFFRFLEEEVQVLTTLLAAVVCASSVALTIFAISEASKLRRAALGHRTRAS